MNVLEFKQASPNERYAFFKELVKQQIKDLSEENKSKTIFNGLKEATDGMEPEFLHLAKNGVTYIAIRYLTLPFSSKSDEMADEYLAKLDVEEYKKMYETFLGMANDEIKRGGMNSDCKAMYYFKMAKS